MAVLNGKIYVAGGYHEQRNLDAVEVQPPAQSRRRCGLGSRRSRRRSPDADVGLGPGAAAGAVLRSPGADVGARWLAARCTTHARARGRSQSR